MTQQIQTTSIKQSKKLIDLGVNVETADAHWFTSVFHNQDLLRINAGFEIKAYNLFLADTNMEYIPSWSLHALLSLLPDGVNTVRHGTDWSVTLDGREYLSSNPVQAAYDLLVWLIESGKFKP